MSAILHSTTGGKWGQSSFFCFFCDSPEILNCLSCLDTDQQCGFRRGTRLADNIRFSFSQFSVGLQRKKKISLWHRHPPNSRQSDTMWEHYSAPTRPFRTFQNKAVVSSNCAQRPAPPSCCLHLCQPPTSLTASSKVQLDLWPRSKELLRLLLFCPHPVSTLGRLDHMWVKVVWWDWRCLWSGGCCPCCCAVFTAWPHSFASTPTATTVSLAELGESVWYLKILYCSDTNPGPVPPEPKWYQLFLNVCNAKGT